MQNSSLGTYREITLRWIPQSLTIMRSQHWFKQWLGAIRQQAITWTNVDQDLCCYEASLSHNKLMEILQQLW